VLIYKAERAYEILLENTSWIEPSKDIDILDEGENLGEVNQKISEMLWYGKEL